MEQLARASAVVDGISGNPHTASIPEDLTKDACHLPHHQPDGTLIWRGVSNGLARLSQTNLSSDKKNEGFSHLKNHAVNDFKKEVTEQEFAEEYNHNLEGGKTMFAKLLASLVSALPEETAKSIFSELTHKLGEPSSMSPPPEKPPLSPGDKPELKTEPVKQFSETELQKLVDTRVAEGTTKELAIINKIAEFNEVARTRVPSPSLNGLTATYEGLLRREQTMEFAEAEKKVVVQPGQPTPKRPSEEFAEGIKGMPELLRFGELIPADAGGAKPATFAEKGQETADIENARRGHKVEKKSK